MRPQKQSYLRLSEGLLRVGDVEQTQGGTLDSTEKRFGEGQIQPSGSAKPICGCWRVDTLTNGH